MDPTSSESKIRRDSNTDAEQKHQKSIILLVMLSSEIDLTAAVDPAHLKKKTIRRAKLSLRKVEHESNLSVPQ